MRVATMVAIMLIHTAPHAKKKISPRRFDGLEENREVASMAGLLTVWLAGEAEAPFAPEAGRRCVRPDMTGEQRGGSDG
jgi:hypothetical protein